MLFFSAMKNWILTHKRYSITFLAILAITVLILYGWHLWPSTQSQHSMTEKILPYQTVKEYETPGYFKVPGTVVANIESQLMAQVVANVTHIDVHAGEHVQKGQLLIQLDDRDYQAKVAQALEQVKAQKALLTNVHQIFQRMQALVKKGYVSTAEYDEANAHYLQAQANLSQAQKALRSAEIALSYCQVRAPEEGIIVQKFVDVGDQTFPLKPLLSFQTTRFMRVAAPIPESLISKVYLNEKLPIVINQKRLTGIVKEIVPKVDPTSRSFMIKITLPADVDAYAGMFAQAWLPTGTHKVIAISQSDIEQTGQLQLVYVQTKAGITRVMVTTGKTLGNHLIEILSGLNPGDHVIVPGVAHAK